FFIIIPRHPNWELEFYHTMNTLVYTTPAHNASTRNSNADGKNCPSVFSKQLEEMASDKAFHYIIAEKDGKIIIDDKIKQDIENYYKEYGAK
ncbi:MAG: hypothetical protein IIX47_03985, partial [Spirochaetaceae bacterium]|nr:hypothetical protein [Spirochaetaceae bacterium]